MYKLKKSVIDGCRSAFSQIYNSNDNKYSAKDICELISSIEELQGLDISFEENEEGIDVFIIGDTTYSFATHV